MTDDPTTDHYLIHRPDNRPLRRRYATREEAEAVRDLLAAGHEIVPYNAVGKVVGREPCDHLWTVGNSECIHCGVDWHSLYIVTAANKPDGSITTRVIDKEK